MAAPRCTICRKLATDGTTCSDAVCVARATLYRERAAAFAQWKPRPATPPAAVERAQRPREVPPPRERELAPEPRHELEVKRKAPRSKKRKPKIKTPRMWWVRDD